MAQLSPESSSIPTRKPGGGRILLRAALGLLLLLTAAPAPHAAGPAAPGRAVPQGQIHSQSRQAGPETEIRIVADAAYFDTLVGLIRNARQRIDVATFLFKTGTARNNRPARLVRELVQAAERGVAVRVILDHSGHDEKINAANRETAQALARGGVTVLFDSPGRTQHGKMAVIDGRHCLVGSHNLTQAALGSNHELSLLIDSPHLAARLLAYMDTIAR